MKYLILVISLLLSLLISLNCYADTLVCRNQEKIEGIYLGANMVKESGTFSSTLEGYKFQPYDKNKGVIIFDLSYCTVQVG